MNPIPKHWIHDCGCRWMEQLGHNVLYVSESCAHHNAKKLDITKIILFTLPDIPNDMAQLIYVYFTHFVPFTYNLCIITIEKISVCLLLLLLLIKLPISSSPNSLTPNIYFHVLLLPEASFGFQVLSLPLSVFACPCVCVSASTPNLSAA